MFSIWCGVSHNSSYFFIPVVPDRSIRFNLARLLPADRTVAITYRENARRRRSSFRSFRHLRFGSAEMAAEWPADCRHSCRQFETGRRSHGSEDLLAERAGFELSVRSGQASVI